MIETKKLIKSVVQKYALELILLFGSRASNQANKKSDFDVAYLSKKKLDLIEEAQLIIDLAPIFQSEDIDLVNLKKANPLLLYAITKNCQVVYERRALVFSSLRAYAFKKYIETKTLYESDVQRTQEKLASL